MIYTQGAKDERNSKERLKNTINAVKTKKLLSLVIEPASICNLTCKFCDLHSGRLNKYNIEKHKGIMKLELYNLIVNEIDNLDFKFDTIFFHGNGEPLLNKNLIEMISIAVNRKISKRYVLFTNGTLMKPDIFDSLILSGVNEINVSLDTINYEVYEKLKGKNILDDVLNNIDYAINRVIQNHSSNHSSNISLVIKSGEGGDIYGLDNKNIQEIINKYRNVVINSKNIHIKNVPIIEQIDGMINRKKEYHTPCEIAFYMAFIKYDGRVSICCADVIDELNIGKIGLQYFKDILKGQQLHKIREIHLLGNLDKIPLCKYCGNRTAVDLSDYREQLLDFI